MTPRSFVIVCEASADKETASVLADRVILEGLSTNGPADLSAHRIWRGEREGAEFIPWKNAGDLVPSQFDKKLKLHGHFDNRPGAKDAHSIRHALLGIHYIGISTDAVFLIRDTDGDERETKTGFQQAIDEAKSKGIYPFVVVAGLAHPKREAWVLAGFEAVDDNERKAVESLRKELVFSPVEQTERLTAKHAADKKSAKRVLEKLTGGDSSREAECWETTSLDYMRKHGSNNGLNQYLEDVSKKIHPLFLKKMEE